MEVLYVLDAKNNSYNIRPFLTILLLVQPTILQNMASKSSLSGNGLQERFFYVLPKSNVGYRTLNNPPVPEAISNAYRDRMTQLLNLNPFTGEQVQDVLTLDTEAWQLWQQYRHEIEKKLRPTGKLYECRGWGAKLAGYCLRIAGLLHVMEHLNNSLIISFDVMERAIRLCRLVEDHALASFGLMGAGQLMTDAKEILKWIKLQPNKRFRKSDITYALRNRRISQGKRLNEALEVLKERHYIREDIDKSTRRPTTWFGVNPNINHKK